MADDVTHWQQRRILRERLEGGGAFNSDDDSESCPICLNACGAGRGHARELLHYFCLDCIVEWSKVRGVSSGWALGGWPAPGRPLVGLGLCLRQGQTLGGVRAWSCFVPALGPWVARTPLWAAQNEGVWSRAGNPGAAPGQPAAS